MTDKDKPQMEAVAPPSIVKPRLGEDGKPVPSADEQLAVLRAEKAKAKGRNGREDK